MKKVAIPPNLLKLSEITSSVTTVRNLQKNVDTVVEAVQCVREMTKICDLVLGKFSKVITSAYVNTPLFVKDYEVDIDIFISFGKDFDIIQDIKNFLESKNYKFKKQPSIGNYFCKTEHFFMSLDIMDMAQDHKGHYKLGEDEVCLALYTKNL